MYGRRYNEGLHQAIEAKEGVKIADESKTLATITFQNYFRMYNKLSGMTGTAMTEEAEFREIYNLDVVAIPTNKPVTRIDETDVIYKNESGKYKAIIDEVKKAHEKGQPILIGTVSIEKSEKLSGLLKKEGLKHEVLNAKNHEKEAEIIAQAGKFGAITIATNMAGRGTDIMLGGNSEYLAKQEMRKQKYDENLINQATAYNETNDEEVLKAREKYKQLQNKFEEEIDIEKAKVIEAGGLKIIGTERHESRRIDNQLRGRSGRQGDPGTTKFFLGLDDNLVKLFGGDIINSVFERGNIPEDLPIQSKIIAKTIESAQSKVEGQNFSIRKHILNFDDVMNVQREIIYAQRRKVLDGDNIRDNILDMIMSSCEIIINTYSLEMNSGDFNKKALENEIRINLNINPDSLEELKREKVSHEKLIDELKLKAEEAYIAKEKEIGNEIRKLERIVLLKIVDTQWMEHIDNMDELKNGIGLRAYGQKDPIVQYRIEGADMFDEMINQIKLQVTKIILYLHRTEMKMQSNVKITGASLDNSAVNSINDFGESVNPTKTSDSKPQPIVNDGPKVGRNDPCPCGSGKKYKNCCGKNA